MKTPIFFNRGFVVIIAGRHKGKTGYWDETNQHGAIVYLGGSATSPVIVKESSIRQATNTEAQALASDNFYGRMARQKYLKVHTRWW